MTIDKLTGKSKDIVSENIYELSKIFPNIFTEGKINFDKLKAELGEYIDDSHEKYEFTWPGKMEAVYESQKQINETLRPCRDESKNWETTKNLYIEGNNLDVLRLIQNCYPNKVKAIYIDPPYNTGNDILYKNDYSSSEEDYLINSGQVISADDNNGSKLKVTTNTESNGRFNSDWLSMMYPLLKVGRNLLSNDGIIFIAIDDNEVENLKKICMEIFGEPNYIGTLVTLCNPQGRDKKNLDPIHEYHLIFAKNKDEMKDLKVLRDTEEQEYQSFLRSGTNSRKHERPKRFYPMLVKNNEVHTITPEEYSKIYIDGVFDEDYIQQLTEKYESLGFEVIYPIAINGEEKVWQRKFERAYEECSEYICENGKIKTPKDKFRTPVSLWTDAIYSNVQHGTNLLKNIFDDEKIFDYPKSIHTVKKLISMAPEGIVLDFFSGSATTAHAIMEHNNENDSNYRFIMVQIPAKVDEKIDDLDTICEIGKERIRRAGDKIVEESNNNDLDIGFKVFKLDSSNLEKWDPDYNNIEKSLIEDQIKEGRTNEDLVYEIMLETGVDLTLPIEKYGNIYSIGFGALVVCLENNITKDITNTILDIVNDASISRVVFKDSGFASDEDKTNIKQILKDNNVSKVKTI